MKKLALVLILVLCASVAQAQWKLDNVGLYLDPADMDSYCTLSAGEGIFHVYIVGTNMTSPTIKGIEFKLSHDNALMANLTFPPGADFGNREDEHTIAYYVPEPVLGDGSFIFAQYDILISDASAPTFGYLRNLYFHSLPEPVPAYLDGEDLNLIKPLRNSTGDVVRPSIDYPVLILNGDCDVVPNEDATWGDVKALFQ